MKRLALALVAITFLSTACLKTRGQLKDDPEDEAPSRASAPAKIQEVQPQGGYALDEIKAEITKLNGRLEDLERDKAQGGGRDDAKKIDNRIAELEHAQLQMIEELKKLQEAKAASHETSDGSSGDFDKARKLFEAKEYEDAIQALSAYLKTKKPKRAEDATFLRGEAYFNLKEYKKAIVDFSKFPEKFTKSKYMAHALLRIGQSFDALGMKEDAKGFYQELQEKFPKSSEAKRVRVKARP